MVSLLREQPQCGGEWLDQVVNRPKPEQFRALTTTDLAWSERGAIPLSTHTPFIHKPAQSNHKAGPLLGLQKHWMSISQQHIYIALVFFAIGFSAITALDIAAIGWFPLDIGTSVLVWPSLIVWLVLGVLYPNYGKLALKGLVIGLLATFSYDCMRFVTIWLGLSSDFIPGINRLLFHTNKPNWVVGYIWRYVGDGGLMSVAFVVGYRLLKPKLDVRIAALFFGLAIWLCLVATLLLAPQAAKALFPLTPITLSLSLLGHVIYGLSIGFLYPVFISDSESFLPVSTRAFPAVESLPQTRKEVAIVPEASLNVKTDLRNRTLTSQFVKPGFINAGQARVTEKLESVVQASSIPASSQKLEAILPVKNVIPALSEQAPREATPTRSVVQSNPASATLKDNEHVSILMNDIESCIWDGHQFPTSKNNFKGVFVNILQQEV